jgi:leader peptidase (prepilin peptidase)/N-methyltransferase
MAMIEVLQTNPVALMVTAGALGLAFGSFLNVVIHRLPVMLEREWRSDCAAALGVEQPAPAEPVSLVRPRSRCPLCGHRLAAWENIPVLSYLLLRGRCSACGGRISARYPLVEVLTAAASAVVAWHFGPTWQAAGALALTWALVALAFIDLDTQLLPDDLTLPTLWLGLALNLAGLYASLPSAVVGAMAGYLILWAVYQVFRLVTGKEGMGQGDFKLLAMLGAWLGWESLPVIVLLSSVVGASVGIGLLVLKGQDRDVPIPFGPYLAAGGWVALLWGDALTRVWLGSVG